MANTLKLYEVRDGSSFIGTYFATNEKHAIQRAVDEQLTTAATFRKGQPAVVFKGPSAIEIKRA